MVWIAAYLYVAGTFVAIVTCDMVLDGRDKRILPYVAFLVTWPVSMPALLVHGIFTALRDEFRAWRKV